LGHFFHDLIIILPAVGLHTAGAILDTAGQISKAAAAAIPKAVQRAIAEEAIEILLLHAPVAGEIFAFPVLKKRVIGHRCLLKCFALWSGCDIIKKMG
jgi:hypothetical protein